LLDKTFKKSQEAQQQGKQDGGQLASSQNALLKRLQNLKDKMKDKAAVTHGADAMARAEKTLRQNDTEHAQNQQNEALQAMKEAEQSMAAGLQQSLFGMPQMGSGQGDPFGREDGKGFSDKTNSTHIPDRFEAQSVRKIMDEIQHRASDTMRPKTERDYIERLLQNF
jgi:hypothetical protein